MFEHITISAGNVLATMDAANDPTDKTSNREQTRSRDWLGWARTVPAKRTVLALLGVEAASFFLAAMVHAGIFVHGYEHRAAMIAESVIGAVLLVGLAMTWLRSRSVYTIAAGVQAFALLGTLVGVWTIIVGIGPRTIPDVVYHVVIALVLAVGLVLAWRSRDSGVTYCAMYRWVRTRRGFVGPSQENLEAVVSKR